jgi:hypothetical protein
VTGHDVPVGAGEIGLAAAVAGVAPVPAGLVELAGLELPVLLGGVVGVAEAVAELGVDDVEPLAAEPVPLAGLPVELVEAGADEVELSVVPLVGLAGALELAAAVVLVAGVVADPPSDGDTPGSGMTTVGITGSRIGADEVPAEFPELSAGGVGVGATILIFGTLVL